MIAIALYWRIAMRRGILGGIFIKADIICFKDFSLFSFSNFPFFPSYDFFGKIRNDALDNFLLRINLPNATENFHKSTILHENNFLMNINIFAWDYSVIPLNNHIILLAINKQAKAKKNLVIMIEICMAVKKRGKINNKDQRWYIVHNILVHSLTRLLSSSRIFYTFNFVIHDLFVWRKPPFNLVVVIKIFHFSLSLYFFCCHDAYDGCCEYMFIFESLFLFYMYSHKIFIYDKNMLLYIYRNSHLF